MGGQNSTNNSSNYALLWSGTAASAVNLNPAGFSSSHGMDLSGPHQVGFAGDNDLNMQHAILWSGTAASAIDLNPPGFDASYGWGIAGSQQVGSAEGPTTNHHYHGMLWTSTAASGIDLNPSGFLNSDIRKTNGHQQVGLAWNGNVHVFVWTGTADERLPGLSYYMPNYSASSTDFYVANMDPSGNIVGWDNSNFYHSIPVVWYNGNVYTAASPDWNNASSWLGGLPAAGKDILIIPTSPSSYTLNYAQSPPSANSPSTTPAPAP